MSRKLAPSEDQSEKLVAYLEENRWLALGHARTWHARHRSRVGWQNIANELNCDSQGCYKTWQQWAKYWIDKKSAIKRKAALIKASKTQRNDDTALSPLEERIMTLMEGGVDCEKKMENNISFPVKDLEDPCSMASDSETEEKSNEKEMEDPLLGSLWIKCEPSVQYDQQSQEDISSNRRQPPNYPVATPSKSDLKESQATLIMCRHEKDDLDRRLTVALQQLDTCKRERDDASGSLALANEQIESLKESNERLEEEAAELAALRARAALADTLEAQLQRETERAWTAEQALSTERARAETCLRREAAALEHAARLTAAHVHERARAAEHDAKAQALAADNTSLRETVQVLQEEAGKLRSALNDEMDRRNKENRVLARKVAELTEEAAEANKKLEYEQGENSVLKKKHASAIKELNRELNRALKRIEMLEAKLPQNDANSTRTGSVSSLSSIDSPHDERVQNGHADIPDVQPDQRLLVERIVSLQRAAAARSERCEFLQEHCAQLTRELRRKSRVLRAALPALPPAALASRAADQHKSEIAQLGGGAMAAVWGGDPGGMTLELSLEMNKRLQAVLEDTLLKNITLKENIDTLGEEISRLREQVKNNENK